MVFTVIQNDDVAVGTAFAFTVREAEQGDNVGLLVVGIQRTIGNLEGNGLNGGTWSHVVERHRVGVGTGVRLWVAAIGSVAEHIASGAADLHRAFTGGRIGHLEGDGRVRYLYLVKNKGHSRRHLVGARLGTGIYIESGARSGPLERLGILLQGTVFTDLVPHLVGFVDVAYQRSWGHDDGVAITRDGGQPRCWCYVGTSVLKTRHLACKRVFAIYNHSNGFHRGI